MKYVRPEENLKRQILQLAFRTGWRRAHFRPARTKTGWRTPVEADGKGFPDLVLVKGPRLLWVECKAEDGRLTVEQTAWIAALRMAGQDVRVWKPSDWIEIEATLKKVVL